MSKIIKSRVGGNTVEISDDGIAMYIGIRNGTDTVNRSVSVNTNEVIEVIEKEVGGIFLKDADLPEVTPSDLPNTFRVGGYSFSLTREDADYLEEIAKRYIVAARHIRANQPPPIDQEQVDAFNKALVEVEMDHPDGPVPYKVAQDLVKAGYKITKEG